MRVLLLCGLVYSFSVPLCGVDRADSRSSLETDTADYVPSLGSFFGLAGRKLDAIASEYGLYWQPHLTESRRLIRSAARSIERRGTALVLGAGKCREIPLQQLARDFDHVVLVDLDSVSMREAVELIPEFLRHKVEIRVSDITTFTRSFVKMARQIISTSRDVKDAEIRLTGLYLNLDHLVRIPDLPHADFVVSSLVLAELARYANTYVAQLFSQKFGSEISTWKNYEELRDNLFHFAIEDHVRLLARVTVPTGVVYFADTTARGPNLSTVSSAEREKILDELVGRFERVGVFRKIQARPEIWNTFDNLFKKLSAIGMDNTAGETEIVYLDKVIENIENPDGLSTDWRSRVAAEAAARLLCRGRLPIDTEISAYQAILQSYQVIAPQSMESLVDHKTFLKDLNEYGLKPFGTAASWFWLEYPCSIPRKPGAFLVNSWTLRWMN